MSEDVAVVEAAPVAEATTETPVIETAEAPKVLTRADARREVIQASRERVFGKETTTPPRDESGKFTASSPEAAQTPPAATEQPTGTPATPQAETQPATIRIELPEGHPLREQGRTFVTVAKDEELAVRALINNPVRQREVETYRQQAIQAQQELQRQKAVVEALREQRTQAMSNPEVAATYAALLEVSPAVAEAYRKGVEIDLESALGAKQSEVDAQLQEQESQHAAQQFTASVYEEARKLGVEDWWLKENLRQEMATFGFRLQNGSTSADPQAAVEQLKIAYLRHPHVSAHYASLSASRQQAEQNRLAQEAAAAALAQAKADEAARLQQAAQRRTTMHPMGQMAGVQTGVRSNAEPEVDTSKMTPRELRNHLRTQTVTAARAI